MAEMFEVATRKKLRLGTDKGDITIEDVWDLPLTSSNNRPNLDDIARGLHRQLKNDDNVSFGVKDRKSNPDIQLKFDLVKHIIDVKLAENESAAKERANKEQKQKILAIVAEKQDEGLKNMSVEDLLKMIDAL